MAQFKVSAKFETSPIFFVQAKQRTFFFILTTRHFLSLLQQQQQQQQLSIPCIHNRQFHSPDSRLSSSALHIQ